MFSKKNKKKGLVLSKKGFTLIEMLIVIVIIGILAAALIPRLSSARGRANDVARKADLAQTAAALVAYQIDHGSFPDCPTAGEGCTLDEIADDLISAGMDGIPTDPNSSRHIESGIHGIDGNSEAGQYAYMPIAKRGIDGNGFVLMAATETEGGSNRVSTNEIGGNISDSYEAISAAMCKEFGTSSCDYTPDDDELRYIYMY